MKSRLLITAALLGLSLGLAKPLPAFAFSLNDLTDELKKAEQKVKKQKDQVDKARGKVSTREEIEIGGNLISGLLGAAPLVDDPALQRYVNDVGFWIAAQSKRKDLPWRFAVIQSDGINAFAAPGGYVVITAGLYSLLENEAQLAAVLAHEIAHVVRTHHLKALQKTRQRDFWSNLSIKAVDDPKYEKRLRKMINAGVQLYATGLDRKYELDADMRGVVLAARAGYDPYALLDVLTTIDSINPGAAELAVMLNTHPPTGERLSILAGKMDGNLDDYASGRNNRQRFERIAAGK